VRSGYASEVKALIVYFILALSSALMEKTIIRPAVTEQSAAQTLRENAEKIDSDNEADHCDKLLMARENVALQYRTPIEVFGFLSRPADSPFRSRRDSGNMPFFSSFSIFFSDHANSDCILSLLRSPPCIMPMIVFFAR